MSTHQKVMFVDASLTDHSSILTGVSSDIEIVHLNLESDGLTQIDHYLQGRSGFDALYILSHGAAGQLHIGSGVIDMAALDRHSDTLAAIGSALSADADILLYGCSVADGYIGKLFVRALAGATGANVAAASHLVGNSRAGGSWELDVQQGHVTTGIPFSEAAMSAYAGVFAIITSIDQDTAAVGLNSDFKTKDTTLTFLGTHAGATSVRVTLKLGTTTIFSGLLATLDTATTWSFTWATTLSAGDYTLTAMSFDSSNMLVDFDTKVITVDTSTFVSIGSISADTGSISNDFITSDQTLVFNGTAEAGATVVLKLDGSPTAIATITANATTGAWTYDYSGTTLTAGSHTLRAEATDLVGNTAIVEQAITVDTSTTGAITSITNDTGSGGDFITNDTGLVFNGTADAGATVTLTLTPDGGGAVLLGTATANGSGNWTFNHSGTALSEGTYSLGILVQDLAGNSATATKIIKIDTTVADPIIALRSDTGTGAGATDLVTSDNVVNVTLAADMVSWEYNLNDSTGWHAGSGTSFILTSDTTYLATAIQVRQTDLAGNVSTVASNAATWVEDSTVATPTFALNSDTGTAGDKITSDNVVTVTLASDLASWEYSLNGGSSWTTGSGVSFTMAADTTYAAAGAIKVRQTDVAGNVSAVGVNAEQWQEDSTVAAPTFALNSDTGTGGDKITSDNLVNVTFALDKASWEYSLNGGSNWTTGIGTSFALADNTTYAANAIQVRQTDIAGNVSTAAVNAQQWQEDSTVATPVIALHSDTGTADNITSDNVVSVTLASDVASWQYSLDSGGTWSAGSGSSFNMADNTTYAIDAIRVRQTDVAGNTSAVATNAVQWKEDSTAPAAPSFALNSDTGISDLITSVNVVNVTLSGDAVSWEYTLNGNTGSPTWVTGTGSNSFDMAADTTYAIGAIKVRQTDGAGNTSVAAWNTAQWVEDSIAPAAPTFALNSDTGAADLITSDNAVNVTLSGGAVSWEYSLNGGTNWNVGAGTSFDLASNTTYAVNALRVRQTDGAGNTSAEALNTAQWVEDSTAPTVAVTSSKPVLNIGDSATITLTFTEVPVSLPTVTPSAGSLGSFTVVDGSGGLAYTATLTPPINTPSGSITFSVGAFTDVALNTGSVSASATITVDTVAPSFTSGTTATFAENATGTVYTATATDVNGVTLSMSGTDANLFDFNPSTGVVTFKASPNFEIPTDAGGDNQYDITIRATDVAGNATNRNVAISLTDVNEAPTTSAVTLTAIAEDSGVRLITQAELIANASDTEGNTLTASALAITSGNGTLSSNGDGTWNYTPAANDDTSVSFSYTITDNGTTNGAADAKSVGGTATLDITTVNDAPTTSAVTLTAIAEDSGVRLITQAELIANA
ncbi:MAG: DUF4347 domain-containing protein, partial [Desulfuromonadaceae bacterium]